MFYLEIHDNNPNPSTLLGTTRAEYEYQIEMWVTETAEDKPNAVRWVMFDGGGTPLREWARGPDLRPTWAPLAEGTAAHPATLRRIREGK